MRDGNRTGSLLGQSSSGFQNIQQAVWSKGGEDAGLSHFTSHRNLAVRVLLYEYRHLRIVDDVLFSQLVADRLLGLFAGQTHNSNLTNQGQRDISIAAYPGMS